MKKINEEETSAKKHRSFNVKRFATVMACALILVGATVGVAAKLNVVDKISNVYTKWQWDNDEEVVLNEEEKQIIEDISIDVGYEFEVDGGKIRIDGIMYDSRYISVLVCFCAFLINDVYGFINWQRMKERQAQNQLCIEQ